LEADALVHSDQRVEMAGHSVQELSIVKVRPAEVNDARSFVACQVISEAPWHAVVEENAHIAA
jgi:hypothetical protein